MKKQLTKFEAAKKRLQSIPAPLVVDEFATTLNHLCSLPKVEEELKASIKMPFMVQAKHLSPSDENHQFVGIEKTQLVRTLYYGIVNSIKSRGVKQRL
jgi:hypothetical protein